MHFYSTSSNRAVYAVVFCSMRVYIGRDLKFGKISAITSRDRDTGTVLD